MHHHRNGNATTQWCGTSTLACLLGETRQTSLPCNLHPSSTVVCLLPSQHNKVKEQVSHKSSRILARGSACQKPPAAAMLGCEEIVNWNTEKQCVIWGVLRMLPKESVNLFRMPQGLVPCLSSLVWGLRLWFTQYSLKMKLRERLWSGWTSHRTIRYAIHHPYTLESQCNSDALLILPHILYHNARRAHSTYYMNTNQIDIIHTERGYQILSRFVVSMI